MAWLLGFWHSLFCTSCKHFVIFWRKKWQNFIGVSVRGYWWKEIRNSLPKKSFLHNISSKIRAQTTETCEDCQLKKLISAFCLYRESIYNTWYQAEFSSVFYVFVFFDIPMQKIYYIIVVVVPKSKSIIWHIREKAFSV